MDNDSGEVVDKNKKGRSIRIRIETSISRDNEYKCADIKKEDPLE